jgi:transcription initiation factor TFIID TATA-box-binding protein
MVDVRNFIIIQNVVASASLDQSLDLNDIVKGNRDVEYHPEIFPGLLYRLKKPKTSILIFRTGKMVCTGAKSSKNAIKAINKVVKELKKSGIVIPGKAEIKIVNMVASGDLNRTVDLEQTAFSLERTMYEPEQFPGLIYRMDKPKVVLLIFASGKIVCTGATKEEEVTEAVDQLNQTLQQKGLIFEK